MVKESRIKYFYLIFSIMSVLLTLIAFHYSSFAFNGNYEKTTIANIKNNINENQNLYSIEKEKNEALNSDLKSNELTYKNMENEFQEILKTNNVSEDNILTLEMKLQSIEADNEQLSEKVKILEAQLK